MEVKIGGKYKLCRRLSSGSRIQRFLGTNTTTGEDVLISLEPLQKVSVLQTESKVFRILQEGTGIPRLFWCGCESDYNILITELVGSSLSTLLVYCKGTFSLKTVLMLADQIISRVEFMHSYNYVHRDIKPENFLVGIGKKANVIYMVKFNLAKKYIGRYNQHVPYKEGKNFIGTARYASLNTFVGIEQSRRDDLESIGYMLVYLLKGKLPWQGLLGTTKAEKYENIMQSKANTSIEELCTGLPHEFCAYFQYCKSLRFEEKPDYSFLRRIMRELFTKETFTNDSLFDWCLPRNKDSPRGKRAKKV